MMSLSASLLLLLLLLLMLLLLLLLRCWCCRCGVRCGCGGLSKLKYAYHHKINKIIKTIVDLTVACHEEDPLANGRTEMSHLSSDYP